MAEKQMAAGCPGPEPEPEPAVVAPPLARVGAECVARAGPAPIVVLNRAPHDQPGLFALPNSPMGARLALGGREPLGELGRAVAELADLLEQ